MDLRRSEQIETDNPSEETLQITNQWKELVKPGEDRTSNRAWDKYSLQRHYRAEIKQFEMTRTKEEVDCSVTAWKNKRENPNKNPY